jgi:hypothetical protein
VLRQKCVANLTGLEAKTVAGYKALAEQYLDPYFGVQGIGPILPRTRCAP